MVCSDNWGIEVVPNPDESLAFPVHQLFIVKHGIYNLENIITEELAAAQVYEFAFSFAPLRLKGATGSPATRSLFDSLIRSDSIRAVRYRARFLSSLSLHESVQSYLFLPRFVQRVLPQVPLKSWDLLFCPLYCIGTKIAT